MTNEKSQQDSFREGRATVLVVDDEPMVCRVCRRMLESAGHCVLTAVGAEQAIEAVRDNDIPIDVLLCDVLMPGVRGGELAIELRELEPKMAVIFISGYADDPKAQAQIDNGSARFLAKPFFAADLLEMISVALATD